MTGVLIVGAVDGFLAESSAASTCAARHHLAPATDPEPIAWFAQTGVDTARVVDWSCAVHDKPDYELCVLGAVWFIRRRDRKAMHETHREPRAVMQELWHRLLVGAAR